MKLVVAIGDIHGRFLRLEGWLDALEAAHGRRVDQVLAVGDVEAFVRADDHRRKAAKRAMPAEFVEYAEGRRMFPRPLAFVGGNNEDFETLYSLPDGGELAKNVRYLGRVGAVELAGLRIGFLSGIHAPRFFDAPRVRPTTVETAKHEGYFRRGELERALALQGIELMLMHEWPRRLLPALSKDATPVPGMPSPWMGNPLARAVLERVRPAWLLCGHSHRAFSASVTHPEGRVTRVACLDQAAHPETALFWMHAQGGQIIRAGWGLTDSPMWEKDSPWTYSHAPQVGT